MPTTLTLIAHASTAAARHATFPGDEPLDALGLRDCARLKLNFSPARVWIAPELRTRQTAEALGLAGDNAPSLRDGDYGTWAGKPLAELAPDALQLWLSDPEAAPMAANRMRRRCGGSRTGWRRRAARRSASWS